MGNRGGGRKQKQNNNFTPFININWKLDNYLCTKPALRHEIEAVVRDKAPRGAYHALISPSGRKDHATVNYKIRHPDGRTERKTEHIYPGRVSQLLNTCDFCVKYEQGRNIRWNGLPRADV